MGVPNRTRIRCDRNRCGADRFIFCSQIVVSASNRDIDLTKIKELAREDTIGTFSFCTRSGAASRGRH